MTENERLDGQKENGNVSRGTLNEAGTAVNGLIKNDSNLHIKYKISERILHIKTRRRLNRYLDINGLERVNERNLNLLAVIETWMMIKGRKEGAKYDIINWGGYSANWLFESKKALKSCLELGLIREWNIRVKSVRIGLTEEGERILWLYDQFYNVVLDEIQVSHDKALKKKKRSYKCKGQPPAPAQP